MKVSLFFQNFFFQTSIFICNTPSVLKKKKKCKSAFCGPRVPPPNPTTHHSHPLNFTHISSLFWPTLSFLSFIFSLFILLKHTHTHPPASTPKHTISPSFFQQDHRKNTYELQSIFIILFEVKVQIFFLMGIMFLFEVILPKL